MLAGLPGTRGASHLHRLRWPSFSTPPCFVLSNQRANLMQRLLRPFSRPDPAKPVTLVRAYNLLVTFLPALYRVSPFRPASLRQVARNPSVQLGRRSRPGPSGGALRLQIDILHHCSSIILTNLYRNLPILPFACLVFLHLAVCRPRYTRHLAAVTFFLPLSCWHL